MVCSKVGVGHPSGQHGEPRRRGLAAGATSMMADQLMFSACRFTTSSPCRALLVGAPYRAVNGSGLDLLVPRSASRKKPTVVPASVAAATPGHAAHTALWLSAEAAAARDIPRR